MKILKIMNNNAVASKDDTDREIIVLGKGIGFKKHINDEIDETCIEKIFRLPDASKGQFEKLVEEIPYEYVKYSDEVIQYASNVLGRKLNKNIYITLTDHLNFAIERQKQGVHFKNALLWEIKKFYQEEYKIGLKAIELIKNEENIELPIDEAGFIALHIVNAAMDGKMCDSLNMPTMIKDIINIVRYTFGVELDEESLWYERFVTHLKFFIQRAVNNECYPSDGDKEFHDSIKRKAIKEYACAEKIRKYVHSKLGYEVAEEEMIYLTVHISRVIRRTENGDKAN